MPTLNWIGKEAVVNHHKEVPFRLLKCNEKLSVGEDSGNLLIQGDNLEALKALLPYYAGQVKCIYIDPPYNTGNEGWVYNDNVNSPEIKDWLNKVVGNESEDLSRHDKWLCMMYPRLVLLRQMLREDGAIFISIDDNEFHNLRGVMNEIFGNKNFVETFIWRARLGKGATAKNTAKLHEYVLCFAKNINHLAFKSDVRVSEKDNKERLRQWGQGDRREDRPTMYYPVESEFGAVYPIKPDGTEGRWRIGKSRFDKLQEEGRVVFELQDDGRVEAYRIIPSGTETETAQDSILDSTKVKTTAHGSKELFALFNEKLFDYPKPTTLIQHLLTLMDDKNALILDSFSGSGTTGHAVLKQNAEDGGQRKFILIEMDEKIASTITAERLNRVINGYGKEEGLGGGFRYCELGATLFDGDGQIREEVKYNDLAQHVYFVETGQPIPPPFPKGKGAVGPLLGVENGTAIYLLYNGILKDKSVNGGNVLTNDVLQSLPPSVPPKGGRQSAQRMVIYGNGCRIGANRLRELNITFKQIPYEIREM